MKILHVVEAFGGGVFECLVALANHQAKNPWARVSIAYSIRAETPEAFRNRFDPAVEFISLGMTREINPRQDLAAAYALARLYRRMRPDVVHMHSSKAGVLGRAAGFLTRQRGMFYTPHGFSFLMRGVSRKKIAMYRAIEALAAKLGGTIVGCSESEGALAKSLARRATFVPNGIDLEKISRHLEASSRGGPGPIVVAISGRIAEQRNPSVFCEVANRVTQARPGEFKFVWVGGGDQKLVPPQAAVETTGWLSRDEALKTLADADIYFHPSLWEGLPLAVLEAMALRLPVVTTDVPGNRDAVVHQQTGVIANSVEDMAAAIIALGDNPITRQQLGANGLLRVTREFSLEQMLAKYDELYNDVRYK